MFVVVGRRVKAFWTLMTAIVLISSAVGEAVAEEIDPRVAGEDAVETLETEGFLVPARAVKGVAHRAKDILAKLDLSATLDLLDLELADGLSGLFGYQGKVEPAYRGSLFTRMDRWRLQTTLSVGDFVDPDTPIFVDIEHGAEIHFIRQFATQKEALTAPVRFDVSRLPVNAERAWKLPEGEVVILPARMNIFGGLRGDTDGTAIEMAGASYYLLSGTFQLQIIKLKNQRVRVRMIGVRGEAVKAEGELRYDFDVLGLGFVLEKLGHKTLLANPLARLEVGRDKGLIFMADYIFNLNTGDGRSTYDGLIGSQRKFREIRVLDPQLKTRDLPNQFLGDLTEPDRLADEDSGLPPERQRVSRVFRGYNEFSGGVHERDFGRRFFHLRKHETYSNQKIYFLDRERTQIQYFAPTQMTSRDRGFFFGFFREQESQNSFLLIPSDEQSRNRAEGKFVVNLEIKDKTLRAHEGNEAIKHLKQVFSKTLVERLGLERLLRRQRYENTRLYTRLVMHESAFLQLSDLSLKQLQTGLEEYLESNKDYLPNGESVILYRGASTKPTDRMVRVIPWLKLYRNQIETLPRRLKDFFEEVDDANVRDRIGQFLELQKDPVFRAIGPGYLVSLLPESALNELILLRSELDATGLRTPTKLSFGFDDGSEVIDIAEYLQHQINEGGFDLRLENFGDPAALTSNDR